MPFPRHEFTTLNINRGTDYAGQASGTMAQASQSYASMDKKKPQQEDGSWVGDAAFLYAMGKETGAIDDVKKAGETYIPKLSEFLGGETQAGVDPTKFDAKQMSPGVAPGSEFSAASAPKQALSPTAASTGSDPLAATKGMIAGEGTQNAAQAVAKQQVTDQASRAGVQAGVAGAGEAVGGALTGATGAGAATLATAPAGTTAMVGGLSTAAGGVGAGAATGAATGAAAGGALSGAAGAGAAAGTSIMPGVGTAVGLGIGALIAMFA